MPQSQATSRDSITWGVLSTSATAVAKAIPALQRCTNARLRAIASRDGVRATAAAQALGIPLAYGSYDELFGDDVVDADYLPLPNSLHCEYTVRAAMAGKHVLCEKPAALYVDVAAQMLNACKRAGVMFMEGLMYRFLPQTVALHDLVRGGALGDVRRLSVSMSFMMTPTHSRIRLQRATDGGAIADLGIYGVSLACLLLDEAPARVTCFGRRESAGEVETAFAALIEFPSGAHALLDGAFDSFRQSCCEVIGTEGTARLDGVFTRGPARLISTRNGARSESEFADVDPFQRQFEHFSSCVLNGMPPEVTGDQTCVGAAVLQALRASLGSGHPADVRLGHGPHGAAGAAGTS